MMQSKPIQLNRGEARAHISDAATAREVTWNGQLKHTTHDDTGIAARYKTQILALCGGVLAL